MSKLELPHTAGCVVCGPFNPHGLRLTLRVDEADGVVSTDYVPLETHVGFVGVLHGGVMAAVADEAMVWAATWAGRRFCLCGELTVRYRAVAPIGQLISIVARVVAARPRLVTTSFEARDRAGALLAEGAGKYVPLPADRNAEFVATLLDDAAADATRLLREAAAALYPPP